MTAPRSEPHSTVWEADRGDRVERTMVLEAEVADGVLLVDPARVRAHGLNASATAVWRATADSPTVGEVVERVADVVGVPVAVVEADVRRALVELAGEGLIDVGRRPPPAARGDHVALAPVAPVIPNDRTAHERHAPATGADPDRGDGIGPFRGFDVTFDLAVADPGIRRALAEVWAPLAVPVSAMGAGATHHYRIIPAIAGDRAEDEAAAPWSLTLDGAVVARVGSDAAVVAQAVWHANQLVSTATARFLRLHAAGVVLDGEAVLLPAEMNSGKSTLATALVQGGAGYLTDETVALDLDTAALVPYPKAITLDPGSWAHFARLEPPFLTDQPHLAHGKWYVHPDAVRARAAIAPTTTDGGIVAADIEVSTIVLLAHDADRPTTLDRLTPVEAAAALARNAFNVVAIGQRGVDLLARLASTVPCWSLSAADIDSGAAAITDAATGSADRPHIGRAGPASAS